jgi:hypothetical protein
MSPERVAQLACRALIQSKRDMILSFGGKALVIMGRLFPKLTDRLLEKTSVDSKPIQSSDR